MHGDLELRLQTWQVVCMAEQNLFCLANYDKTVNRIIRAHSPVLLQLSEGFSPSIHRRLPPLLPDTWCQTFCSRSSTSHPATNTCSIAAVILITPTRGVQNVEQSLELKAQCKATR